MERALTSILRDPLAAIPSTRDTGEIRYRELVSPGIVLLPESFCGDEEQAWVNVTHERSPGCTRCVKNQWHEKKSHANILGKEATGTRHLRVLWPSVFVLSDGKKEAPLRKAWLSIFLVRKHAKAGHFFNR